MIAHAPAPSRASVRVSSFELFRNSARTYADPAKVAPHRPVHTVAISTCGECRHAIGFDADHDPVHAVPGLCASGCGTAVAPFVYRCGPCVQRLDERAAAERARRLAGRTSPVRQAEDDDGAPEPADREDREHGRESNPKYREARAYAAAYSGTFDFMLAMHDRVTGPKGVRGPLSERMVEAILKCKAAELARQAVAPVRLQTGRDLSVLPFGRTYAAVDNDEGGVTFLIIDRPDQRSRWSGWAFVKQQQGPNEVRIGSQRPGETYVGQWPSLIDRVLADPVAAVARYGLELGVCGICHAPLTNEESRRTGIGPVCRTRIAA